MMFSVFARELVAAIALLLPAFDITKMARKSTHSKQLELLLLGLDRKGLALTLNSEAPHEIPHQAECFRVDITM